MKKFLAAALMLGASPALAHHPLSGAPMTTFADGALSGIGHPVLGFDHLFFVALAGIAGLLMGRRFAAPGAYLAAMLLGCGLMYAGIGLPAKEAMIALSLLVMGGIVLSGRAMAPGLMLALFAGFGLFHGSAFGDAVAGVEGGVGGAVLMGYLLGLSVVQFGVAVAAGWVAETVFRTRAAGAVNARLAGAVVAGAGLLLTLEAVEGTAFAALGWG
jgi:urease accessory protein